MFSDGSRRRITAVGSLCVGSWYLPQGFDLFSWEMTFLWRFFNNFIGIPAEACTTKYQFIRPGLTDKFLFMPESCASLSEDLLRLEEEQFAQHDFMLHLMFNKVLTATLKESHWALKLNFRRSRTKQIKVLQITATILQNFNGKNKSD